MRLPRVRPVLPAVATGSGGVSGTRWPWGRPAQLPPPPPDSPPFPPRSTSAAHAAARRRRDDQLWSPSATAAAAAGGASRLLPPLPPEASVPAPVTGTVFPTAVALSSLFPVLGGVAGAARYGADEPPVAAVSPTTRVRGRRKKGPARLRLLPPDVVAAATATGGVGLCRRPPKAVTSSHGTSEESTPPCGGGGGEGEGMPLVTRVREEGAAPSSVADPFVAAAAVAMPDARRRGRRKRAAVKRLPTPIVAGAPTRSAGAPMRSAVGIVGGGGVADGGRVSVAAAVVVADVATVPVRTRKRRAVPPPVPAAVALVYTSTSDRPPPPSVSVSGTVARHRLRRRTGAMVPAMASRWGRQQRGGWGEGGERREVAAEPRRKGFREVVGTTLGLGSGRGRQRDTPRVS